MNRVAKVGIVLGGYVAAFVVAGVAEHIRWLNTQGPDSQASGGMYAAGDAFLWAAVFFLVALVPTGFWLYFLRAFPRFWARAPRAAVTFAVTGPVAVVVVALASLHPWGLSPGVVLTFLALMRMFLAVAAVAFDGLFALLSPTRSARRSFALAGAVEAVVVTLGILRGYGVIRLH